MKQISFFQRIFFAMFFAAFCIVFSFEFILYENINSVRVESMKTLALTQARLIASNQNLRIAVRDENESEIGNLMTNYDPPSNIDYVSVTNADQIRLFHSEGRGIGQPLVEADVTRIQAGNDVTSVAMGIENKLLIKARVPVMYDGKFAGIVSVGINYDKAISELSNRYQLTIVLSIVAFVALIFSSQRFVHYIRRKMQNQSPQQIEMALKLRQGILNTVLEGVIAVDRENRIMVINDSAQKELHIVGEKNQIHDSPIQDHLYPINFFRTDNEEEAADKIITCNGETLIANRKFMFDAQGNKTGAVISFRIRREKEELEQTINAVIQDKENLRAIIHEFNNQMSVVYGLLQMKQYEKAMDFIQSEHNNKQSDIYNVSKTFQIPTLVALVLSKISRAKELGVILEIDPLSSIRSEQLPISENQLTCIVGNLINNAFEAIVRDKNSNRRVRLYIHQGNDFIIEVEDGGTGISDEDIDKIFQRGYTNKNEPNHGVGLNLIHTIVTKANGTIIVEESELGGALFNIYIPSTT